MGAHLFVVADSLAFHGPERIEQPTDDRLYPMVCARELGAEVDLVAREGWTARDAWWALTKDPMAYGVYLPRADYVVIGVGGMDQLPASIPTWLRDSLPYVRPGGLRRRLRRAYRDLTPGVIRALPLAVLPVEPPPRGRQHGCASLGARARRRSRGPGVRGAAGVARWKRQPRRHALVVGSPPTRGLRTRRSVGRSVVVSYLGSLARL